jgi:hypothetical protein
MGIGLALTFGVVFAMYRNPLLSYHPSGEPEPEAEKMAKPRMELQGPMSLMAVEVNCHTDYRQVR